MKEDGWRSRGGLRSTEQSRAENLVNERTCVGAFGLWRVPRTWVVAWVANEGARVIKGGKNVEKMKRKKGISAGKSKYICFKSWPPLSLRGIM